MRKHLTVFVSIFALILLLINIPKQNANAQDNTAQSDVTVSDAVYADLALRHYLDNVSVYSINDNSSENISINPDKQWIPASTVKTFVAMYAYKQISDKKLNLSDSVYIKGENVVPTEMESEDLPALNEGDYVSIQRLIRQMIIQSDNTAYNSLLDILDRQKITDYIHSLGLNNSAIGSKLNLDDVQTSYELNVPGYGINTTTAEDYAKAFVFIKQNKIPQAKDLFNVLKEQRINNMLPLLLPKNITVAHKTGDLDPLYHDGGIVENPQSAYVLSVFSNLGDPYVVAHISQIIYTKNYDLVGGEIKRNVVSSSEDQNPAIDPLVYAPRSAVLGANTNDNSNIQAPGISAADLGIKADDLSLNIDNKDLPKVIIPADSPIHFLVPAIEIIQKGLTLDPKKKTEIDLNSIKLEVAEAKDLQSKGENQLAGMVLNQVQNQLTIVAKNKEITTDQKAQTEVQSISETRFAVLGDELKKADKTNRSRIIKQIAAQAKETVTNIAPNIPQANAATNPSQKPLIGDVIKVEDNKMTIKTAGGQQITIPTNDQTIKAKERIKGVNTPTDLSSVRVGTTVALIGSSSNKGFSPSFVLTNLPKELAAPQPVIVLKVNTKNNTLVVSENGLPIQINITSQTAIKGTGTNAGISSIKPGDLIVVHGDIVVPPASSGSATVNQTQPKFNPRTFSSPSSSPANSQTLKGAVNTESVKSNQASSASAKNMPSLTPSQTINGKKTVPEINQPKVIKGVTIEVLEKKQDLKNLPQVKKETGKLQGQNPAAKPQAPKNPIPPAVIPSTLPANSVKK